MHDALLGHRPAQPHPQSSRPELLDVRAHRPPAHPELSRGQPRRLQRRLPRCTALFHERIRQAESLGKAFVGNSSDAVPFRRPASSCKPLLPLSLRERIKGFDRSRHSLFPFHRTYVTIGKWLPKFATSRRRCCRTAWWPLPRPCRTSARSPWASGCATAPAAKSRKRTASPTSSSTWFSRARSAAPPRPSPAKWILSAACSTPLPPKNRSASTPKCLTSISPLPST